MRLDDQAAIEAILVGLLVAKRRLDPSSKLIGSLLVLDVLQLAESARVLPLAIARLVVGVIEMGVEFLREGSLDALHHGLIECLLRARSRATAGGLDARRDDSHIESLGVDHHAVIVDDGMSFEDGLLLHLNAGFALQRAGTGEVVSKSRDIHGLHSLLLVLSSRTS